MADVRSMLRTELASRKASSTSSNTTNSTSKKRKAPEESPQDRKKTKSLKPELAVEEEVLSQATEPTHKAAEDVPEATSNAAQANLQPDQAQTQTLPEVDEDEWAAFEASIATLPPEVGPDGPPRSDGTIVAAPISAEELAARARVEESKPKKGRRDEEMEEEKEDAKRALEDEFEEMEGLEERVRRLRERREALRGEDGQASNIAGGDVSIAEQTGLGIAEDDAGGSDIASDYSEADSDEWADLGRR